MDVKEHLETRGTVHFHRGSVLCALTAIKENIGKSYYGFVGFYQTDPRHGSSFTKVGSHRLYRVPKEPTGNSAIDKRWWMRVESHDPFSFDKTLDQLKAATDMINHPDPA